MNFYLFDISIICCRQKNQFYRLATTSETALEYVVKEVEKELANDKSTQLEVPPPVVTSGPSQSSSSQSSENSLQAIRNKFRLKKQEVNCVFILNNIFLKEVANAPLVVTAESIVQDYLANPCTESDCLRYLSLIFDIFAVWYFLLNPLR